MKRIQVEQFTKLRKGETYLFETVGFKKLPDGNTSIGSIGVEDGILIRAMTKEKEIKIDGEFTGKYETVPDTVVYKTATHQVTIGCGLFAIYGA